MERELQVIYPDFLSICKRIGKRGDINNPNLALSAKNMERGIAYSYNGYIQFLNSDYIYVTLDTEFARDFLKRHGFEYRHTGEIGISNITVYDIFRELYAILEDCDKQGYSKEEAFKAALRNRELRLSYAFVRNDPVLRDDAFMYRSVRKCGFRPMKFEVLAEHNETTCFDDRKFAEILAKDVNSYYDKIANANSSGRGRR